MTIHSNFDSNSLNIYVTVPRPQGIYLNFTIPLRNPEQVLAKIPPFHSSCLLKQSYSLQGSQKLPLSCLITHATYLSISKRLRSSSHFLTVKCASNYQQETDGILWLSSAQSVRLHQFPIFLASFSLCEK